MRWIEFPLACWLALALSSYGDPVAEPTNPAQTQNKAEEDKGKTVAVGYSYQSDSKMKTVRVKPLRGGQTTFDLVVGEKTFPLEAGKLFDFTKQFPDGVDRFIIQGINPSEKLDPDDPMAFPTGISWIAGGAHELRMMPITKPSPATDPKK